MFKKLLSSALAVIFVFTVTLSVPAFADENTVLREENIVMVKYDTKTRETTRVEIDPNISKRNSSYNTVTEDCMESKGYHPITDELLPTKVATASARSLAGTWTAITTTTVAAYQNTVYIKVKDINDNWYRGSGFMIGPNAVATAGHLLYDIEDKHGFVVEAKVYPGRTGNTIPYGEVTASTFSVANQYVESENSNYDWGIIELDSNIGYTVGWMEIKTQTSSYNGTAIRTNGYPAEVDGERTRIMYRSNGTISNTYTYRLKSTNTKSTNGMSGGPLYIKQNDVYKIIGILTQGDGVSTTMFIKIDSTVYSVLILYRNITA